MDESDRDKMFGHIIQTAFPLQTTEDISQLGKQPECESESEFQKFSSRLKCLDNTRVDLHLSNLDSEEKVCRHSSVSEDVSTVVETFIGSLLTEIGNIDDRFTATCINSGSFYDGLKIGGPDEFDFVVRLETLSKPGVCEARFTNKKKGFVYLMVTDEITKCQFDEFLEHIEDDCLENDESVLSVKFLQSYFSELVTKASVKIKLPPELINPDEDIYPEGLIGYNHGPCCMLKLRFCNDDTDIPLDIDIAPAIAFPDNSFRPPLLTENNDNEFLLNIEELLQKDAEILLVPFSFDSMEQLPTDEWYYHYSETWRISFSRVEQAIFERFSDDSTEKMVVRILKVLKDKFLIENKQIIDKANTYALKLGEPPSSKVRVTSVTSLMTGKELLADNENKDQSQTDNNEREYSDEVVLYDRRAAVQSENEEIVKFDTARSDVKGKPKFSVQNLMNVSSGDNKELETDHYSVIDENPDKSQCSSPTKLNEPSSNEFCITSITSLATGKKLLVGKRDKDKSEDQERQGSDEEVYYDREAPVQSAQKNKVLPEERRPDSKIKPNVSVQSLMSASSLDNQELETYEYEMVGENPDQSQFPNPTRLNKPSSTEFRITSITSLTTGKELLLDYGNKDKSQYDKQEQQRSGERFIHDRGAPVEEEKSEQEERAEFDTPRTDIKREPTFSEQCLMSVSSRRNPEVETVPHTKVNDNPDKVHISNQTKLKEDEPLMQTYVIKMLFFYTKMAVPKENWKRENLTSIILIMLRLLFYTYSAKERRFLHFWFRDFIGKMPLASTSVEMVYCLKELVDKLEG